MIKPYGPTTDPCIILLVIAVTDEHTLFTLVCLRPIVAIKRKPYPRNSMAPFSIT